MLKARWHARENAPDTADPRHDPRARHRVGQGRRRQELGHRQPGGRARRARASPSACSTPTSGASRSRACSACRAGSEAPRRSTATSRDHPQRAAHRRRPAQGRVSTGNLVDDEGTALMWRGLMLTKAVEQFLRDVQWGHLDYLLIDMPPGTGDVQMGLARMLPRTDLHHRHDAGGVGAEGRDPGRRHGPALVPAGGRRDREHERLHVRPRRDATPCSARAAARPWPTRSAPSCSARSRSSRASPPAATSGEPVVLDGEGPAADAFRAIAAPHRRPTPCRPCRWPAARPACSSRSRRRSAPRNRRRPYLMLPRAAHRALPERRTVVQRPPAVRSPKITASTTVALRPPPVTSRSFDERPEIICLGSVVDCRRTLRRFSNTSQFGGCPTSARRDRSRRDLRRFDGITCPVGDRDSHHRSTGLTAAKTCRRRRGGQTSVLGLARLSACRGEPIPGHRRVAL